jgi:hypothetical protein
MKQWMEQCWPDVASLLDVVEAFINFTLRKDGYEKQGAMLEATIAKKRANAPSPVVRTAHIRPVGATMVGPSGAAPPSPTTTAAAPAVLGAANSPPPPSSSSPSSSPSGAGPIVPTGTIGASLAAKLARTLEPRGYSKKHSLYSRRSFSSSSQ